MQELTPPNRQDTENFRLIEDVFSHLGTIRRWWRLVALILVACIVPAVAYLARIKPVYHATTRLLIFQQGGKPLTVGSGDGGGLYSPSPGQSENVLATHGMIIRSPIIVERALAASSFKTLSPAGVISRLSVKVEDETARILDVVYQAESGTEAVEVVRAVVDSYDHFLEETYRKNSSEAIALITRARGEMGQELEVLERKYLEIRQKNPSYSAEEKGRSYYAQRIKVWEQTVNQAAIRVLQLRKQLELGRKLAGEGLGATAVAGALSLASGDTLLVPTLAGAADATHFYSEGVRDELETVENQRLTAERLLTYLRANHAAMHPAGTTDSEAVVRLFYADRVTADLKARLDEARSRVVELGRVYSGGSQVSDPAMAQARRRVRTLELRLGELWARQRPELIQRLKAATDSEEIHHAESELVVLEAKALALRERWNEVRGQELRELRLRQESLVKQHGPNHPDLVQLQAQIDKLVRAERMPIRGADGRMTALLRSIEGSLETAEGLRAEMQRRLEEERSAAKETETELLAEEKIRADLNRQWSLFDSISVQLKNAQLVGDYGHIAIRTLSPPTASLSRPQSGLILSFALMAGCVLGIGGALVADLVDARIHSPAELRRLMDLSVLGIIPRCVGSRNSSRARVGLISHESPQSIQAESYRSLRTSLQFDRRQKPHQVILVTSPYPGDGKTTTASNLAISLALAGRKVLLIDADLRNPSQHRVFDRSRERGLTLMLNGVLPFDQVVQPTSVPGLDLLTAGQEVRSPAELLASHGLSEHLEDIRRAYQVVIIDSSPLLVVTDPSILAAEVDGILLVTRASQTRRRDAMRVAELLKALGTPVLGAVLNGTTPEPCYYPYQSIG
ncbi:polysaccharide biosynthesis tyrosine autokinase [Singulisphaera sp. Ch08]|uniref:non-specific protein-tyrosine kinase n=1 Tax=Singulisphaera sp. Ch08 TaxID=3120278 RepID=A0AAU7CPS5_9BACT